MNKFKCILGILFIYSVSYGADYYWVNGSGNWTDAVGHWATTSGGTTMHASTPTISDDVYFDSNSFLSAGQTITINTKAYCKNFFAEDAINNATLLSSLDSLIIYGSFILNNNININISQPIVFKSSGGSDTIHTLGKTINSDVIIEGASTFVLTSNLDLSGSLLFKQGVIEVNNFDLTCYNFNGSFNIPKTLTITTGNINLNGDGNVWNINNTSFTLNQGTSTIYLNYLGTNTVTFSSAGFTYNKVVFNSFNNFISAGGTYNNLTFSAGSSTTFPSLQIQTIGSLNANGACGEHIILKASGASPAIWVGTGAHTLSYLSVSNIQASGTAFNANNSFDEGNNSGITFTEITDNSDFYWIGGNGEWHDATHWSSSSGGVSNGCIPGPNNDVFFDGNSGFTTGGVILNRNAYCNSMDWTGASGTPSLTIPNDKTLKLKGDFLLAPNVLPAIDGAIEFYSGNYATVNTFNKQLNGTLIFKKSNTANIISDILTTSIRHESDSLLFNGNSITINNYISNTSANRVLSTANSDILLLGADTVWQISPNNFVYIDSFSTITIQSDTNLVASFYGGNQTYEALVVDHINAEILDTNTFNYLEIKKGKTLALESDVTQTIDSLVAIGSCDSIITLQSTANFFTPARIQKQGYDTLFADYCLIKNIDALITGNEAYYTRNTNLQNSTINWYDSVPTTANTYYWVGNGGNWSDVNHWSLLPGGSSAGCLPTAKDTIIFDLLSITTTGQTVLLDIDASCAKIDFTLLANPLTIDFRRDLNVSFEANLHPNLTCTRNNNFSAIYFVTDSTNGVFNPADASLNLGFIFTGATLTDTLTLTSNLDLGNFGVFIISKGTFISQASELSANSFNLFTDNPKNIILNSTNLSLYSGLDARLLTNTTFDAGTSNILIEGSLGNDYFYGNGFNYHNLEIDHVSSTTFLSGSNSFNKFKLSAGIELQAENGSTQTINDSLLLKGTCYDSISIFSDNPGLQTTFNIASGDYIATCINYQDVAITSTVINTLFSSDLGNNSGITFDPATSSTPNFTIASYQVCLGDTIKPINTSTAFSGLFSDLSFSWDFSDGTTSNDTNPDHLYLNEGKYYIELSATFTNGCTDIHTDSVNVNDPSLRLFASDGDTTICENEEVTFTTSVSGDTYQFFINSNPVTGMITSTSYFTDSLNNGDSIYATTLLNGCPATSLDTLVWVVNPNPVLAITSSAPNDTLCDGDTVTITATGATNYQYFLNNIPLGLPSNDSLFKSGDLNANDSLFLIGSFNSGCSTSSDTIAFHVNPIPLITFTNTGSNVICDGDSLLFVAGGGESYQYSVNSIPTGGFITSDSLLLTNLSHTDTVRVTGDSLGCLANGNIDYIIAVNPIPNTSITPSVLSSTICDGENLTYTFSGATTYEVFINDVSQGPASGTTTYSSFSFSDGDRIKVLGSAFGCDSLSVEDTITVLPLPIPTLTCSDSDTIICLNDSVTFTANGADQYQFFIDGVAATSIDSSNTYKTDSLKNNEVVTVIGYVNGCGQLSTNQFTFSVKPLPSVNISGNNDTICQGESVLFTAIGATSYEFLVNSISQTPVSASNTYNTDSLQGLVDTITAIGYLNGCSNASNNEVIVVVNPSPTVLFSIDQDTICDGDTVIGTGVGSTSYQFLINGSPLNAFNSNNTFSFTNLVDGQTLSIKGETNGCISNGNTAYTIGVNTIPSVSLSSSDIDQIICGGDSVSFNASGAISYTFFINDSILATTNTTGIYSTDSLENNQKIHVIGENNGCSAESSQSFIFTVNTAPNINLTTSDADTTICQGESITFIGSGANLYEFYLNNLLFTSTINPILSISTLNNGDTLSLIGNSSAGCIDTANTVIIVKVDSLPSTQLLASVINTTCIGDTITFNASGATNYEFFVNGFSQGISSSLSSYTTDSLTSGDVVTVIGEQNGCYKTADSSFTYQVYNYPNTLLSLLNVNTPCVGDTINYKASGGLTYEFFVDNVSQGAPTINDTFSSSSLTVGQKIYAIGYNNGCGSKSDSTFTVQINSYPSLTTTTIPTGPTICFDDTLTVNTQGANTYQYFVNQVLQTTSDSIFKINKLNTGDTVEIVGFNGVCPSTPTKLSYSVTKLNLSLSSPDNFMSCDNSSITLTASGASQYQFFINGTSQGGFSTTNTLSNTFNTGDFVSVIGQDFGCNQTSSNYYINSLSSTTIDPPGPIKICNGQAIRLTSDNQFGNKWFKDGVEIPNAYDSSYLVTETGIYSIENTQGGNGEVWSIGNGSNGELANATNTHSLVPIIAHDLTQGIAIDGGERYFLMLKADGSVWSWGDNTYGQLGDGSFTPRNIPEQIVGVNNVDLISAGDNFSIALANGTIWSWGDNTKGQLGLGNNGNVSIPVSNGNIANVTDVSAGGEFTVALDNNGDVWTWGDNQFGQLGDGFFINRNSPSTIGLSNVISVSAGKTHALALDNDGNVWVWGDNSLGQLGIDSIGFIQQPVKLKSLSNIISISAGATHSLALNTNNEVFAFGDNTFGQLGDGTNNQSNAPKKITGNYISVLAGYYASFAIGADASLWSWGKNQYGQLGNENILNQNSPQLSSNLKGASFVGASLESTSVLMTNAFSCGSNTVDVVIDSIPEVIITLTNDTVLSTTAVGTSYQWYLNGNLIPGATTNTWGATTHGTYTIKVTFANGCEEESNALIILPVGIEEEIQNLSFTIYPNPASDFIEIKTNNKIHERSNLSYSLYDINGKQLITTSNNLILLNNIENGSYLLLVKWNNELIYTQRIIKLSKF